MMQLPMWKPARAAHDPAALFELMTELQTAGVRWLAEGGVGLSRKGGAGPSDHKALELGGHVIMVPVHTRPSGSSPFTVRGVLGQSTTLYRGDQALLPIAVPQVPRFYAGQTRDGVPYWKIATLHASDVLASTLLQKCVRYGNRAKSCQFCAIGQSLASGATIAEKTPAQLAEVARAAVELDGVKHMVLTTGTPPSDDRGAALLARASQAITGAAALPVQAQCEPPADFGWFRRLKDAGVATLGMHLEAVTDEVRHRIMPGKAEVPVSVYLEAFEAAVAVFGRGQVTTYILAGLGDTPEAICAAVERVAQLGVYPFVVPFVPIAGTPLADHVPPTAAFMQPLLAAVATAIARHDLASHRIAAGCGRCGACSTLRAAEVRSA